jgi:virginiamycin B lyase
VPDRESFAEIGRITPAGSITEFPVPNGSRRPRGIVSGRDGNLWFGMRMTATGESKLYPVPMANSPGRTSTTALA